MLNVEGKVALITGGSLGIGKATVEIFAAHKIRTYFSYNRHQEEAEALATKTGATALQADLSNALGWRTLVEEFQSTCASLDYLVHNAGIWTYFPIGESDFSVWKETMALNLDAVGYLTNAFVPMMQRGGAIVMVGSTAGRRGEAVHAHYAATKAALAGLAKSWAAELGPRGIRTNVVAPGWVDTPMSAGEFSKPGRKEAIAATIPLRRVPPPEDIAYPILFLVSDWARHITGTTLDVNGGAVLIGG
jgi:3-oxoacyl-[acyl-carrier protein] reductase